MSNWEFTFDITRFIRLTANDWFAAEQRAEIETLLLVVPISLASIHQAVAMILFTVALFLTHALKRA